MPAVARGARCEGVENRFPAASSSRADELETMLAIASEAAALVAEVYATDFIVDYKGPSDPVTLADRRANALICERLASGFGSIPVVAEESLESSFAGFWEAPRAFFVDPLDGTLEFVSRSDEFVVMIGLAEHGRAVAGVVHAPVAGLAWVGAVGLGAWEVSPTGAKRPIRVSGQARLCDAELVVSRSHRGLALQRAISLLGGKRVVARGSAGLKGADVAAARADVYLQPGPAGKRWDSCAPEAIVRAAGGTCTDELGTTIEYSCPELANEHGILMTNGRLHDQVLARLRAG